MTRDDRNTQEKPSVFHDSEEDLKDYFLDHFIGPTWIVGTMFAILDERSATDNTVVMFYRRSNSWDRWRVRFSDAFFTLVSCTENQDQYNNVFRQSHRFTTKDGVFPAKEAATAIQKQYEQDMESGNRRSTRIRQKESKPPSYR